METDDSAGIDVRRLYDASEAKLCARMMANSEPWITLKRGLDASLALITDSSREVYVSTVNDEIVGFVVLLMKGAFVGYVQSICVAPEWRGQGIGTQLMAFVERRIFYEAPNAFICVSSFNAGARRLYERLGYHVVGELEDFVVPGHSEILLRKTIAPSTEFTVG